MMALFRSKPVTVEAVRFEPGPLWSLLDDPALPEGVVYHPERRAPSGTWYGEPFTIGKTAVKPGDWVITGANGERYPCKPDVFEQTYEAASDVP